MFYLQRNNKLLNGYNTAIILAQMANINASPAISILVIVNYIGKYCSKEEKKLTFYQELPQLVQPHANSLYSFSLVVARFINKLITKRNQLAQEVYYLLFNIPLYKGFKNIVTLNYYQEDNQSAIYKLKDRQLQRHKLSNYKKYKRRLDRVEDVTFFNFLLYFNYFTYKR